MPLTTPQKVAAGTVYVTMLFVGTTSPAWYRGAAANCLSTGLSGAYRYAYEAQGVTALNSTLGTLHEYINGIWAAVS